MLEFVLKEPWPSIEWINNNTIIIIIKLRWALFVTYTIIQSITSSEMCSLHLTHPSTHTPGAVGSWRCGVRGAVGGSVPCSRVSPQSWTIPAGAEIQTHNLGLQVQRSTNQKCLKVSLFEIIYKKKCTFSPYSPYIYAILGFSPVACFAVFILYIYIYIYIYNL